MNQKEFFQELEFILELDPGTITGGEKLADLGGWDSLAYLSFIAMVDEKLGQALNAKDIAVCVTPLDLCRLCGERVAG
jgi:acyl carrier protein